MLTNQTHALGVNPYGYISTLDILKVLIFIVPILDHKIAELVLLPPYKRTGDISGSPVHQFVFVARPVFPSKLSPELKNTKKFSEGVY